MEKRILILTNHFYPEYFKINDVVDWIAEEKNHVVVITGNPNYPKGKIFNGYPIWGSKEKKSSKEIIYRLPLIPRGNGKKWRLALNYGSYFFSLTLFTCWLTITHKKYDVVFVHHTSPPFLFFPAYLYKKLKKGKVFLWDLDMWPQTLEALELLKSPRWIKKLESLFRWFYQKFDKILIGSLYFKEMALKRVSAEKIIYFPNWAEPLYESLLLKERYPKKKQKIVITYTGNIGTAQGFDSLLDAIEKSRSKNIEFRFIGSGRHKHTLQMLAKEKELSDYIIFYDPVSPKELINYFNQTDYLYLSLKNSDLFSKTVPAKLQTYLAVGKPIIASISGEAKELLEKHQTGFQAAAENTNQLSIIFDQLEHISRKQYDQFSSNCRNLYQKRFTSTKRRQQLLDILKE